MAIVRSLYNRSPLFRTIANPLRQIRRRFSRARQKAMLRDYKHFLGLLAEDPVLYIHEFGGKFVVGRESSILHKMITHGSYELCLSRLLPKLVNPNQDAIDVGANLGFYSVLLANLVRDRNVLAFEPVEEALSRLQKNLLLNGVSHKVAICPMIASNSPGRVDMKIVVGQEEYSTVGMMEHQNVATSAYVSRSVECTTLDREVSSRNLHPGFIKIDAEGSEHLVLEGSIETLRKHRPVILSELSSHLLSTNGSSAESICKLLASVGYVAIDPIQPLSNFYARDYGDALFVPNERRESIIKAII
jgi:FkbM family methyltransferase